MTSAGSAFGSTFMDAVVGRVAAAASNEICGYSTNSSMVGSTAAPSPAEL